MNYIARFDSKFNIQPVKDHINNVADLCEQFGKKIQVSKFMYLAGILHDMGKYSDEFQIYINEKLNNSKHGVNKNNNTENQKKDHGVYGAKYIYELYSKIDGIYKITAEMLAVICCYHHGGLPDSLNDNYEIPILERFKKITEYELDKVKKAFFEDNKNLEIDELFKDACREIDILLKILKDNNEKKEVPFLMNLLIKTMYSMLIDADRYDSYLFEIGCMYPISEVMNDDAKVLWDKYSINLEHKLDNFKMTSFNTPQEKLVYDMRQMISDECLTFAVNKQDSYTLTVPTGGGKTLSSLRFALKHAELMKKDRIIYIVPYTTIIEQNAETVRQALQCGDELLEYHSNVMDSEKADDYDLLTHRWNSKIIFTTMVQFLNTFYATGTQNTRRIHNLLNSIIIFDEVQSIPIKCIHLFNSCINYLNRVGKSTIILCSATQPLLNETTVKIQLSKNSEMISDVNDKFKILERVKVIGDTNGSGYTYEDISNFIFNIKKEEKSVLVVCNTIDSAEKIFLEVKKLVDHDTSLYYLSTRLCPEHRKKIIHEMKLDLKSGRDVICVSTQLIEAGVDISFATVIRCLSGLDSIAQTAGRCNRNGELEYGKCYVIKLKDENLSRMKEIDVGATCTACVFNNYMIDSEKFDDSLLSTKAIKKYFEYYYNDSYIKNNMDYPIDKTRETIYKLLSNSKSIRTDYMNKREEDYPLCLKYQFKRAAENFKVIDNDSITVIVPYKEGKTVIDTLRNDVPIKEKKTALEIAMRYSVNLYDNKINKLIEINAIEHIEGLGVYVLDEAYYDETIGVIFHAKMNLIDF